MSNIGESYESYEITSRFYDLINAHVDHGAWCDFLENAFRRYCGEKPSLILDLGCGTGTITLELARRGYDMTGIDMSPDMLGVARENAEAAGHTDVLWLCQDMREFELYGTVDAVVANCDAVNYLLSCADLDATFSLIHNYLIPDGIFVFDISSRAKFRRLYRGDIIIEEDGIYCGWQNRYNEKTGIADFYLSYFIEDGECYRRYDETQRQRSWSVRGLTRALVKNGFEPLLVTDSYDMTPLGRENGDEDDRIFFVCRVKKTETSGNNMKI